MPTFLKTPPNEISGQSKKKDLSKKAEDAELLFSDSKVAALAERVNYSPGAALGFSTERK